MQSTANKLITRTIRETAQMLAKVLDTETVGRLLNATIDAESDDALSDDEVFVADILFQSLAKACPEAVDAATCATVTPDIIADRIREDEEDAQHSGSSHETFERDNPFQGPRLYRP